jgi:Domain of unknown function (DUF1937)
MKFWYLASPYSKYLEGAIAKLKSLSENERYADITWRLNMAHTDVCVQAALLIKAGIPVYSPIAHSHPIARCGTIDPLDHKIWLPANQALMDAAGGLIVLELEGYDTSYGVIHERDAFAAAGKPIVFMKPGTVPELPDLA